MSAMGLVLLSFTLRQLPIHWIGRAGWFITTVGAAFSAWRQRRGFAGYLAVASYAWVSRDLEWPIFVSALVLAELVGRVSTVAVTRRDSLRECAAVDGRRLERLESSSRTVLSCTVHVAFLFCLGTLLHIGLQGGLQLQRLDLTVGSFGSLAVPAWLTGTFLVCKFLIAQVLLMVLYLRSFTPELRARLLVALGAAHLVRGTCLLLMLFVCGNSYWMAFRVLADLPTMLIGPLFLVAGLLLLPRGIGKPSNLERVMTP